MCAEMEDYLKSKRNYKTTYTNKEVSLTPYDQETTKMFAEERYLPERDALKPEYYELIPIVKDLIPTCGLTDRQQEVMQLFAEEHLSTAEIGRRLGIAQQAVYQTIYGHPKHGGGALRKIKAAVTRHTGLASYM
jgi:DNA-directed RNA polymerase specialized sigma subunit